MYKKFIKEFEDLNRKGLESQPIETLRHAIAIGKKTKKIRNKMAGRIETMILISVIVTIAFLYISVFKHSFMPAAIICGISGFAGFIYKKVIFSESQYMNLLSLITTLEFAMLQAEKKLDAEVEKKIEEEWELARKEDALINKMLLWWRSYLKSDCTENPEMMKKWDDIEFRMIEIIMDKFDDKSVRKKPVSFGILEGTPINGLKKIFDEVGFPADALPRNIRSITSETMNIFEVDVDEKGEGGKDKHVIKHSEFRVLFLDYRNF